MRKNLIIIICSVGFTIPLTLKAVSEWRNKQWEQRIAVLEQETREAINRKQFSDSPLDPAGEQSFSGLFQALEFATEEYPNDATLFYRWGQALMSHPDFEKAEEKFRRATELDPSLGVAYLDWARTLEALDYGAHKRQPEVLAAYEQAARLLPRDNGLYLKWGFYLSSLGRTDDAIGKYKKHLEIWPDDVLAYSQWALITRDPAVHLKVLDLYERGISAEDPPEDQAASRASWTFHLVQMVEKGMIEPAWSRLQKARAKYPELSTATWETMLHKTNPKWGNRPGSDELANISYFLGLLGEEGPDAEHLKKARAGYAAYLKIKPTAANAPEVKARIEKIDDRLRPRSPNNLDDMFGE